MRTHQKMLADKLKDLKQAFDEEKAGSFHHKTGTTENPCSETDTF